MPSKRYSICLIGNSHTAALYKAWKNRRPAVATGVSLTFFAANILDFRLENKVLVARNPELVRRLRQTSGGKGRIVLTHYDAFVLIGLLRLSLSAFSGIGVTEHLKLGPVQNLVSETCFGAILSELFASRVSFELLDKIRAGSHAPILLCPCPFRPEDKGAPASDDRVAAAVAEQAMTKAASLVAEHGGEILWQDSSTIASPGRTKWEFSKGAVRLQGKPPTEDGLHMNEEFGNLMLTTVLKRLDVISGGRVLPRTQPVRPAGRYSSIRSVVGRLSRKVVRICRRLMLLPRANEFAKKAAAKRGGS